MLNIGEINFFAISGILAAASSGIMAVIMFWRGTERLHYLWGVFCLSVMLWGAGAYKIAVSNEPMQALLWWRIAYIGVIAIPVLFMHFVLVFLNKEKKKWILPLYLLAFFFEGTNFIDGWLMKEVRFAFHQFYYISPPTVIYNFFLAYFIGIVLVSHVLLFREYNRTSGIRKNQIKYFFLATSIGFIGGSTSYLPVYKIDFYPFFNNTVFLFAPIIGYAILRYRLFDLRIVAALFATGALLVVSGIEIFLAKSILEFSIRSLIFSLFGIFGYILVRSVIREIEAKNKITELAHELSGANEELKKLDEVKSEFISVASHQLRAPLTVVKGYISLILEGTVGRIDQGARDAMNKTMFATNQVIKLIADLLNLSRIESGKIRYDFGVHDFHKTTDEVIAEFTPNAEKKHITLEYKRRSDIKEFIFDPDKLREAIMNIIDNAIKYTSTGTVQILEDIVERDGATWIRFSVKDPGIGFSAEERVRLFTKFQRTETARRYDPNGMGLGIYFVRRVIEDHGGKIWAESEGIGKGSRFTFEIPKRSAW